MKKNLFTPTLTIFLLAVFAMLAYAQPGPGGPSRGPGGPEGPGMGIGFMLQNDQIKERLSLTDEQSESLKKLSDEMREQRGRLFRGRQGQGPGQGPGRGERPSLDEMEKMRKEMENQQEKMNQKINAILTPEQQGKYKELLFQMGGGLDSPFLNSRMLETVNLTEEQKAKIKAIEEERGKEFRESMEQRGTRPDIRGMSEEERRAHFEKMRAEGESLRKKYSEKIQSVLTPEQKEKAQKLTEEGKDLMPQRRGPGGPRGERGPEGGEYRPGADSWRPGQGAQRRGGDRPARRTFPKSEEAENAE